MATSSLPLFPLNVVLFPGTLLPIHVFEDRYKALVAACLEDDRPFGVVLIKHGHEVGPPALPHATGTTAHVQTHTTQDDGNLNLVVRGERRFRIRSLDDSQPCLLAEVDWVDDADEQADLSPLVAVASRLFARHIELLFEVINHPAAHLALPKTPELVSYFISARLRTSLQDRQALLELTSTRERLAAVTRLLEERNAIQETFLRLRPTLGPVHSDIAVLIDTYVPRN